MTLDLGILLLQLSERFGAQFVTPGGVLHAFPTPADLADVPEESIRARVQSSESAGHKGTLHPCRQREPGRDKA